MRVVTAVSLFVLGLVVARPSGAQTPIGELPAPYIQQVPPQQPPPSVQNPAAPGQIQPGQVPVVPEVEPRIYGTEEERAEENGEALVEPNPPAAQQAPYHYEQEQQPADDYQGEYDLSSDNAVAQSYDDGYDPQAAGQFADALSPYGTWIDDPAYGRVWQPAVSIVGADFFPYATGGHWVLTEFGWTWVSDWDWGWAPFHYGRWTAINHRGWCWVPGTIWGPAWVHWRAGGGYVGWTPLPPRGLWVGQPGGRGSRWRFTTAGMMGSL